MDDRLNDINKIVNSIKTQKSFNKDLENKADKYIKKYPDLLKDYTLIKNKKILKLFKNGGYIRYVNKNGLIRYGGLLLKVFEPPNSDITMLLLQNKNIVLDTTNGTKIGTAATQLLGFFNATPVVQQASTGEIVGATAGSGDALHINATFTGNTAGSTKAYTINDIVKALKNLGLLAN